MGEVEPRMDANGREWTRIGTGGWRERERVKLNREWTRMDANRNWRMEGAGEVEPRMDTNGRESELAKAGMGEVEPRMDANGRESELVDGGNG